MSHISNYQHIIFRTYSSRCTIPHLAKLLMLKYIDKACASKGIKVYKSNAHRNHVHLLVSIPSNISIESAVRHIKSTSSKAFQGHELFPHFEGWAKRYGSFSVSCSNLQVVSNYIANQEKHHAGMSFYEEFKRLVELNGGAINEYFEADFGKNDLEIE